MNTRFLLVLVSSCFIFLSNHCTAQTAETQILELEAGLRNGTLTVSDILRRSDTGALRYIESFKDLMKKYAPVAKVAITPENEPGQRITIQGLITNGREQPSGAVLMYFYHTMNNGYYGEDDKPRLFGFVKTDNEGKFEISTIKPGGYPGERFPSHIHVQIFSGEDLKIFETEFQFSDDPRMDDETLRESQAQGNLVSANTGTPTRPVYSYKIKVPSP